MSETAGHTQTDDHRVTGEQGANVTVVRVEQPKESPWKQPAIYVAALALIVAIWGEREARLGEYYAIDLEMFARDHGLNPPPDPWGHYKPKDATK